MKNILLIIAFLFGALEASEIKWHKSYQDAHTQSLQEQKIIMVMLTTDDCKFCKKLKQETFIDQAIRERLSENYHSVELNKDRDIYPKTLHAKGVPTIYFLTPQEEVIDYTLGYYDAEEFGYILSAAERRYKKMKGKK